MARSIRGFAGGMFFSWMTYLSFFSPRGVTDSSFALMLGGIFFSAMIVFWDELRPWRKAMFGVNW